MVQAGTVEKNVKKEFSGQQEISRNIIKKDRNTAEEITMMGLAQ